MQPIASLVFALVFGMTVGLTTALRRYGGVVTFLASTGSCVVVLLISRFYLFGFFTSGGGVGILLVIVGMFVSLALWAHQLSLGARGQNNSRCES